MSGPAGPAGGATEPPPPAPDASGPDDEEFGSAQVGEIVEECEALEADLHPDPPPGLVHRDEPDPPPALEPEAAPAPPPRLAHRDAPAPPPLAEGTHRNDEPPVLEPNRWHEEPPPGLACAGSAEPSPALGSKEETAPPPAFEPVTALAAPPGLAAALAPSPPPALEPVASPAPPPLVEAVVAWSGPAVLDFPAEVKAPPAREAGQAPPAKEDAPPEAATAWIEIELVGEDGRPIAGEPYRVELPDGRTIEGALDARGVARLDGLAPGTCRVTLPGLDGDAWLDREARAAPAFAAAPAGDGGKERDPEPEAATTWIEIELVGEDGRPIAGEPYRVELPDGRTVEGALDARGVARLDAVAPGTCRVTLPGLDGDAWLDREARAAPASAAAPAGGAGTAPADGGAKEQQDTKGPGSAAGTTFLELCLVDEAGAGVGRQRYLVELADGRRIEGELDERGSATLDGLEPGTCRVTFPDLDRESCAPA